MDPLLDVLELLKTVVHLSCWISFSINPDTAHYKSPYSWLQDVMWHLLSSSKVLWKVPCKKREYFTIVVSKRVQKSSYFKVWQSQKYLANPWNQPDIIFCAHHCVRFPWPCLTICKNTCIVSFDRGLHYVLTIFQENLRWEIICSYSISKTYLITLI